MTLADLESGRIGTIKCLSAVGIQRQRLLDLGLVPGTKVAMLFANPAGSPIAYLIPAQWLPCGGKLPKQLK